jgi:enoyl-CoA hydratase
MRTTLEIESDIARITMDDGKVNAMSAEMLDEICARLDEARAGARVTILRGRPGIFSAGFDMATFVAGLEPSRKMLDAGIRAILRMLSHPHPIVTACTGHAYPMGAFLMLCADRRYAARGDYRIGMNEVQIGLTVPRFALELAEHRLNRSGFAAVAAGRLFAPDEAVAAGYLDHVVPEDELFARTDEAAAQLLTINLRSYAATKRRINAAIVDKLNALADPAALGAELIGLSNV